MISGVAGIEVELGAVSLRSHSAWRVVIVCAVLVAIRWRAGIASKAAWVTRIVLLTAIAGSMLTWLRFLVTTVGGADSYGYVSAAQLIAGGSLRAEAPIVEWLSAANRSALAAPLGWSPAPGGAGIVPAYPIGLPALMALFSLIGGANAVFFVAPVTAAIGLFLVNRLARAWYDADIALLATALVAWNPLLITYAKQPMSDVPATMWIVLAMCLAVRATMSTAFAAGLAAGAAVMTRPALLLAAIAVMVLAHRGESSRRRAVIAAAGLSIGVVLLLVVQNYLFGSPFRTGYGSTAALFSPSHVITNLVIFAKQGWLVVGPLWIIGLIIGIFAARPEPRTKPLYVSGAVAIPYLFYLPFDHWETLRYLMPGIIPLTVTVANGLMRFARTPRSQVAAAVMLCGFTFIAVGQAELLLRRSEVWRIADIEARYPLAGEWVRINTPAASVVFANQHSGSLRWYGQRQTLRWDLVAPEDFVKTVAELESHAQTVYVALEGAEVAMFDDKFAPVIDRLLVDHVGRVRNITFLRLSVH